MTDLIFLVLLCIMTLFFNINLSKTINFYTNPIFFAFISGILFKFYQKFISIISVTRLKIFYSIVIHLFSEVRMSMSYVFIIKVNDKYLLVPNSKWDFFQPIGGKYKLLSSNKTILNKKFKWKTDTKIETSGKRKLDIAGFIPVYQIFRFLSWFKTEQDREISHWREFYEELIATNILDKDVFPYIEYRKVNTLITPVHKRHFGCLEMLSFDIYEVILTECQEKNLEDLQTAVSSEYTWVDIQLINSNGYCDREKKQLVNISDHTKWTANLKWDK